MHFAKHIVHADKYFQWEHISTKSSYLVFHGKISSSKLRYKSIIFKPSLYIDIVMRLGNEYLAVCSKEAKSCNSKIVAGQQSKFLSC